MQSINTKGELITIRTPGYFNKHQTVCLFSPQGHFWFGTKKQGSLQLSWLQTTLNLPNQGYSHVDSRMCMRIKMWYFVPFL